MMAGFRLFGAPRMDDLGGTNPKRVSPQLLGVLGIVIWIHV